jgi:sarcosine oxidase, subunit delta
LKLIPCPLNGLRPVDEFLYAGELRVAPDPAQCTDEAWGRYVFNRTGIAGVKREWWCHLPSGYWFIIERDTATDEIQRSYAPSALQDDPP